ncbi:MAG TPA: hypothetical protein VF166_05390 [Gemmatimonadaceae bacterium]
MPPGDAFEIVADTSVRPLSGAIQAVPWISMAPRSVAGVARMAFQREPYTAPVLVISTGPD